MKLMMTLLVFLVIFSVSAVTVINQVGSSHGGDTDMSTPYAQSQQYVPVRLVESGLPYFEYWYAEIGGPGGSNYSTPAQSFRSTITFYELPGQYSIIAWSGGKYMTQNQTYSVTVSTSLEVVNIRFLEEFNVSVTVSGLPGGASWQLNIYKSAGNSTQYYTAHSQSATSKNRWDLLGNGTYVLEISQSTYLGALIQLYRSSIAVNGHDMSINLSYHRFNVTEKGLIPGSMWGVVPPGGASYPGVYSFSTFNRSMIIYSANSTDRIDLQSEGYYTPPATFNYTSHASPFVLDFQRCYNITFVEHGIPAVGSNYWSVGGFPTAFDSAVWIGSPGNFSFEVPNGTFNYSTLNGTHQWVIGSYIYDLNFTPSGSNLNFTVNGRDSSVNVYFNYTVVRNLSVPPPAPPSLKLIITVVLVGISTAFMAAAVFYRIRRR